MKKKRKVFCKQIAKLLLLEIIQHAYVTNILLCHNKA